MVYLPLFSLLKFPGNASLMNSIMISIATFDLIDTESIDDQMSMGQQNTGTANGQLGQSNVNSASWCGRSSANSSAFSLLRRDVLEHRRLPTYVPRTSTLFCAHVHRAQAQSESESPSTQRKHKTQA